jgi:DNA-binding NarL/FixJ family response regulator
VRVLVVEDQGPSVKAAVDALTAEVGCDVVTAHDPRTGLELLVAEHFDVVVVDVLFRSVTEEFERRRRHGLVRLDDPVLHLSGLAVVHGAPDRTRVLLWTSGDPNRHLHLLFAYEELGVRAFCSKEDLGELMVAVRHAHDGQTHVDPRLSYYVPNHHGRRLRETILSQPRKLALWRATALGQHQHSVLAKLTGMSAKAVRTSMGEMRARLLELDPGMSGDNAPTSDVVRFAGQNWEFFLDETVRSMFP